MHCTQYNIACGVGCSSVNYKINSVMRGQDHRRQRMSSANLTLIKKKLYLKMFCSV